MMSNQLELTKEQQTAYDRFIKARDKVYSGKKWVVPSDFEGCVDVVGLNHPLFVVNDVYLAYQDAFRAWLDIEPHFRSQERMRASKGDYGTSDSWEEKLNRSQDTYNKIKE